MLWMKHSRSSKQGYRVTFDIRITDEAISDMAEQILYIKNNLCNSEAADKLLADFRKEITQLGYFPLKSSDSGFTYRNYMIHKKVYQSYLIFYVLERKSNTIIILRVLKNIMNWPGILRETKIYHFSNYNKRK